MVNLTRAIILIATTIGAGVFGMPYVFYKAGWVINLIYFLGLSIFMLTIHYLYAKTIFQTKDISLLESVQENLGRKYFWLAFISIIFGLIFTLLVYLILAGKFLKLIFPEVDFNLAVLIFWIWASSSLVWGKFLSRYEVIGTFLMIAIILFVFLSGAASLSFKNISAYNLDFIFLPFGVILFSFAGWTAVGPMVRYQKDYKINLKPFLLATVVVAILYLLFILGIVNSTNIITEDSVSGLIYWSYWKIILIALFGLFAVWTSYLPIALEIKNSFSKKLSPFLSLVLIIFLPIILFGLGFQSFLEVISLAGGLFLALQYFLILLLIRNVLNLKPIQKSLIKFLEFIFVLAAIYEIYFSILK